EVDAGSPTRRCANERINARARRGLGRARRPPGARAGDGRPARRQPRRGDLGRPAPRRPRGDRARTRPAGREAVTTHAAFAARRRVIEIAGLQRIYRLGNVDVAALRGIDLTVAAGEFVAVMGTSGSGKSTLLHILGCLDRPTAGAYRLEGVDV